MKLCNGYDGPVHAADACPTAKDDAVMAVASKIRARGDEQEEGMVQTPPFQAEETWEGSDSSGERKSARKVEDETWIYDSGASTHMTPSADYILKYRECNLNIRIVAGSS